MLEGMPTRAVRARTVADYMALPCEWGVELIDGVFYDVTPAPGADHQSAILRLGAILESAVRRRKLGRVFVAPFDVVLSDSTVVQPDVTFIARAHLDRLGELLEGPPDIAVEFLSKHHRDHDLVRKKKLYFKHGLPEYWIGDPAAKTLEVFRRGHRSWSSRGIFRPGQVVRSPLLPGVRVSVRSVYL